MRDLEKMRIFIKSIVPTDFYVLIWVVSVPKQNTLPFLSKKTHENIYE